MVDRSPFLAGALAWIYDGDAPEPLCRLRLRLVDRARGALESITSSATRHAARLDVDARAW